MSYVKAFTVILDQFMQQLICAFPEEKDLKVYHLYASNLMTVNPRLLATTFKTYVAVPYRTQIETRDEKFFLDRDYTEDLQKSNTANLVDALKLKQLWTVMSASTKQVVWDYLSKLLKVSELI